MTAHFISASSIIDTWAADLLTGKPPILWRVGKGFDPVELGPGMVCLVGGAPGAGKTALTMQWVVDALRTDASLRVMVANIEMTPRTLLDRQLARLAGLDASWIRFRRLTGQEDRVHAGLDVLRSISDRLAFHDGPPTLVQVAENVDAFGAQLLVLDYVQRFSLGDKAQDKRAELDDIMGHIRRFANGGLGVLVVSAMARQKGATGSNYAGLGLASFRGSGELEFGGDQCWTLAKVKEGDKYSPVRLSCHKNREGEEGISLLLNFDRMRQTFTLADSIATVAAAGAPRTYVPTHVPAQSPSPTGDTFDLGGEGYAEDDTPFE